MAYKGVGKIGAIKFSRSSLSSLMPSNILCQLFNFVVEEAICVTLSTGWQLKTGRLVQNVEKSVYKCTVFENSLRNKTGCVLDLERCFWISEQQSTYLGIRKNNVCL